MKKFLSLILALIMTTALLTVGANAVWDDDAQNNHLEEAQLVVALKLMNPQGDHKELFQPRNAMSRGFACRVVATMVLGPEAADALPAAQPFDDVFETNANSKYINWCKEQGIVSGYGDGKFGPAKYVSRDAFLKMMLGARGYKAGEQGYNKADGWRWEVLTDAQAAGLLDDVTIGYAVQMARDECAKVITNTLMTKSAATGKLLYEGSYPTLTQSGSTWTLNGEQIVPFK